MYLRFSKDIDKYGLGIIIWQHFKGREPLCDDSRSNKKTMDISSTTNKLNLYLSATLPWIEIAIELFINCKSYLIPIIKDKFIILKLFGLIS